jgi:hypothetical protein
MDASRRLTSWLRLVGALVLALGLSSATAAAASADRSPVREPLTVTHLSVVAASLPSAVARSGIVVRHAVAKHHLPVVASGLAASVLALTGVAAVTVRRRHTDATVRHHALSDDARAPPAVSGS